MTYTCITLLLTVLQLKFSFFCSWFDLSQHNWPVLITNEQFLSFFLSHCWLNNETNSVEARQISASVKLELNEKVISVILKSLYTNVPLK